MMRSRKSLLTLAVLITLVMALAGCSPGVTAQQPTPTVQAAATQPPTAAATATAVPSATPTTTPPTETPEPTATATATPLPDDIGAPGIGDPYFPRLGNGGYDVQHYTIDLDVDMAAQSISSTVNIEAEALHDLERFNLDFIGLTIDELSVNGQAAEHTREASELIITPAEEIAGGEPFTVTVSYTGTPGAGVPQSGPEYTVGWAFHEAGVFVAGEPSGASGWYPVNEHPLDKATYTFEITVDEPWVAAANGVLINEIDEGAERTYVWDMDDPAASYLITVAIGEFDVVTDQTASGIPIRNYFAEGVPQPVRDEFEPQAEMIDYFETIFGPYPFDVYGAVVHDRNFSFALETQTLAVFGKAFVHEEVISHELAHMWFGNNVSLEKWQDIWLNEGFATYSSALWVEHQRGREALEDQMRGAYGAEAQASIPGEITPMEMTRVLMQLPFERDTTFSRDEVVEAVLAIFGEELTAGEVTAQARQVSGERFSVDLFGRLLGMLPQVQGEYSRATLAEFLRALGEDEMAERYGGSFVIGDPSPNALFAGQVYRRGALTLHALRHRIGDEAFFELLRTYTERYGGGNASTEDFITLAEEVSGQQLDEFFNGWLYQDVLPDIPEAGLRAESF